MEAEIRNKFCFLMLLFLFFWGCGGPYYYDLNITARQDENPERIDKILMVDDIWAQEDLWRQSMIQRRYAYRIRYFPFDQWAKTPGELIKDTIIQYYKNSLSFTNVIDINSSIEPDFQMKIKVVALEMMYENSQWKARLSLDIELMDFDSEKVFLTHSFDRKMELDRKRPKYVPEKISKILQEELDKVFEKLRKFIVQNTGLTNMRKSEIFDK